MNDVLCVVCGEDEAERVCSRCLDSEEMQMVSLCSSKVCADRHYRFEHAYDDWEAAQDALRDEQKDERR